MQNSSPLQTNSFLHCFNCCKQLCGSVVSRKGECPVSSPTTDSLAFQLRILCETCTSAFQSIDAFISKHGMGEKTFRIESMVDSSLLALSGVDLSSKSDGFEALENRSTEADDIVEEHEAFLGYFSNSPLMDVYSSISHETIKRNCLPHVFWLPSTLQYMLLRTQEKSKVKPEERRERVKRLLQIISTVYCVEHSELRSLAILVQTLLCYANQNHVFKLLDVVIKVTSKNCISLGSVVGEQLINGSTHSGHSEDRTASEERLAARKGIQFRPEKILETLLSLVVLSKHFKHRELHGHLLSIGALSIRSLENGESEAEHSQRLEEFVKGKVEGCKGRTVDSVYDEHGWQQFLEWKQQKNNYLLILKTLRKEQTENQEYIKEMEGKFRKEKDEYVKKIVKLSNRIEELEGELCHLRNNEKNQAVEIEDARSNPERKAQVGTNTAMDATQKEQRSISSKPTLGKSVSCTENKGFPKLKSQNESFGSYLQCIVHRTELLSFNQNHVKKGGISSSSGGLKHSGRKTLPENGLQTDQESMVEIVIEEISQIQKRVLSLTKENKKLREESSRIFSILKHKDQKWLPLLQERDDVISAYEKALQALERGVIISEQPLRSRILKILDRLLPDRVIEQKIKKSSVQTSQKMTKSLFEDKGNTQEANTQKSLIKESSAKTPKKLSKSGLVSSSKKIKGKFQQQSISSESKKAHPKSPEIKLKSKAQKDKECAIY